MNKKRIILIFVVVFHLIILGHPIIRIPRIIIPRPKGGRPPKGMNSPVNTTKMLVPLISLPKLSTIKFAMLPKDNFSKMTLSMISKIHLDKMNLTMLSKKQLYKMNLTMLSKKQLEILNLGKMSKAQLKSFNLGKLSTSQLSRLKISELPKAQLEKLNLSMLSNGQLSKMDLSMFSNEQLRKMDLSMFSNEQLRKMDLSLLSNPYRSQFMQTYSQKIGFTSLAKDELRSVKLAMLPTKYLSRIELSMLNKAQLENLSLEHLSEAELSKMNLGDLTETQLEKMDLSMFSNDQLSKIYSKMLADNMAAFPGYGIGDTISTPVTSSINQNFETYLEAQQLKSDLIYNPLKALQTIKEQYNSRKKIEQSVTFKPTNLSSGNSSPDTIESDVISNSSYNLVKDFIPVMNDAEINSAIQKSTAFKTSNMAIVECNPLSDNASRMILKDANKKYLEKNIENEGAIAIDKFNDIAEEATTIDTEGNEHKLLKYTEKSIGGKNRVCRDITFDLKTSGNDAGKIEKAIDYIKSVFNSKKKVLDKKALRKKFKKLKFDEHDIKLLMHYYWVSTSDEPDDNAES